MRTRRQQALALALGCFAVSAAAGIPRWEVDLRTPQTGTFELRVPLAGIRDDFGRVTVVDDASSAGVRVLTIDPSFYPPGSRGEDPSDARAIVRKNFAVLRTDYAFPRPASGVKEVEIVFRLPDGWAAVTPWEKATAGRYRVTAADLTRVDYLGFGPFDVVEHRVGDSVIRIGIDRSVEHIGGDAVARLYDEAVAVFGGPPRRSGNRFAVTILRRGGMHGGSAGAYTMVQAPNPITLAHEMTHWWNHAGVVKEEARWFIEGFTEYYGIVLAERCGLITAAEANQAFGDLYGEAKYIEEREGLGPLTDASAQYGNPDDPYAGRVVYSKGALLGWALDRVLAESGQSLDAVMAAVCLGGPPGLGTEDIQAVFRKVYGGAVDAMLAQWLTEAMALPAMPFPEATGASGLAMFLPGRE